MHLSMYCPTTPLGIILGYSGDLIYPDVKCPIVGQTEYVKSLNAAPHKPQLQHGDLTYPTFKKDLSVYAFVKCPIVGQYFCAHLGRRGVVGQCERAREQY